MTTQSPLSSSAAGPDVGDVGVVKSGESNEKLDDDAGEDEKECGVADADDNAGDEGNVDDKDESCGESTKANVPPARAERRAQTADADEIIIDRAESALPLVDTTVHIITMIAIKQRLTFSTQSLHLLEPHY